MKIVPRPATGQYEVYSDVNVRPSPLLALILRLKDICLAEKLAYHSNLEGDVVMKVWEHFLILTETK